MLPALLRGLVRTPVARAATGSLADRLAGVPEPERPAVVLELVRSHAAAVLGHSGAEAIDPERPFKELGFDSLAAVEFRNQLARASGLRLPATLVFDHPTPAAVAEHLHSQVTTDAAGGGLQQKLDELEALVTSIAQETDNREWVIRRLRALMGKLAHSDGGTLTAEQIESATADEVIELIDKQLGGFSG
jgi:acyl carrier protein